MSINELGALGELIGAIAVVATLAYLTLQVRQSNINNRANAIHQVWSGFQDLMTCFRSNPELCNVIRKGFWEWETLSKNDRAVLHSYWGDLANHCALAYNLHVEGALPDRVYVGWEDNLLSAITTDGLAQYWNELQRLYPHDFVDRIRQRLAEPSTLPPSFPERFSFWQRD